MSQFSLAIERQSKREIEQKQLIYSKSLPFQRSFKCKKKGIKFLYGYAALFNAPDDIGTLMTREVAEASEARLRKFPAVHFMHKSSLGQIIWDREIEGARTFIDDVGFHVLVRVYDQCEKEWSMIQNGNWGFSYGFMPAKDGVGQKCIGDSEAKKCYPAFVKGFIYEISVVDAPAHMDSVAHTIKRVQRFLNGGHQPKRPKGFGLGFRGQIDEAFKGVERQAKKEPVVIATFPSGSVIDPTYGFPLICSKDCPHVQCSSWGNDDAISKPCRNRIPTNEEISVRNIKLRSFQ